MEVEMVEKIKPELAEMEPGLQAQEEQHQQTQDQQEVCTPAQLEQEVNDSNEDDDTLAEANQENEEEGEDSSLMGVEKMEVMQFDTSQEFAEVFGAKSEFDSWDEFTKYLVEFQSMTGTTFKPRSACSIDYANERRINGPIPERFVYSNVKMICFNFGTSHKRGPGQRRDYVGKGCGAFMNVSFKKGALRITQSHHIHSNHEPVLENEPQRNLRVFNFTEDLDLMLAREVNRVNPFEYANSVKQWITAVDRLKKDDDRFSCVTPRLVKKRIRFLMDKFLVITHGRQPPVEDEMGNILYELDRAKKESMDGLVIRGRKKRGPGRPRKRPHSDDDEFFDEVDDNDIDSGPVCKRRLVGSSPSSQSQPIGKKSDISTLLAYLKEKDEEDRRLRKREMEEDRRLRQREIDLRKEELQFQKEKFEFEKVERRAQLDLMKTQLQTFEHSILTKQALAVVPKADNENHVTEYTIVVDGNNQVLESVPTLG